MRVKKLFSLIIALSIILSMLAVPASASGFSSANIASRGIRVTSKQQIIKGNSSSSSYYSFVNSGSNENRVVTATMKNAFKSSTRIIDNATDTEVDAHFVHARTLFSIKQAGSEKVVFRINVMNPAWKSNDNPIFNIVVPSSGGIGYISTYGGAGNKGVSDNDQCYYYTGETGTESANGARDCIRHVTGDTPDYQVMDLIIDCKKGYAFCFVDGRIIATHIGAIKNPDSQYRGYSIIGSNSETVNAEGTKLWLKYDPQRPGDTVYVDTEDYTVRLEDVLVDAGLASNSGAPNLIAESNELEDYIFAGTFDPEETITYERRNGSGEPVSITAEKFNANYGNVAQLYGGTYLIDVQDWPGYAAGKSVIHVSFDQKINTAMNDGTNPESDNFSYRLHASGRNVELFYMQPDSSNKLLITLIEGKGANNKKVTVNKDFNDTVHYDVVLYGKHYDVEPETETSEGMGYYFVDGQYIGSSNVVVDDWWTPTQLFLYSNSTASVTYSNYRFALYDENQDVEELVTDIGMLKPIWKNTGISAGENTFNISGTIKAGKDEVPQGTKAHIAIYDANNKLLDCDSFDYAAGEELETKNFQKSYAGIAPKFAKFFIWDGIEPKAIGERMTISPKFSSDPIYVLAIGNSFSKDSVRYLSDIANADGVNIIPYNAYKAGRTLANHYDAWVNNTADYYRVEPYGVSNGTYKSTREYLQYQPWDYVILQGTTHYNEYDAGLWGVDETTTENYWTTLKNGVAEFCPDAKRLVHATWAPINALSANVNGGMFAGGTPDSRGAYLSALLPHEQAGADIYSTEERADGEKAYIPTAVAVDYLVRHYRFPEYEGVKNEDNEYDNSASTRGIYRDTTCHLTDNVGKVLAGLVWYEMITGIPATENAYQRETLSEADMASLKAAAHYACQNYTTYDPAQITPIPSEEVSAEVMKSKNGADATVVFIHDDGHQSTVEFMNSEFPKYNMDGTVAIIGSKIDTSSEVSLWTNLLGSSNGRLNFASHSFSHRYFGESDNAESGTLKDGSSYNYSAGHMTLDIANERSRINGLFPNERVLGFVKPGTSYPSGKVQVSDAAYAMIRAHYIAMRNTGGGVDTIPPANIYSVKSFMVRHTEDYTSEDYQNAAEWKGYLSEAINKKGIIVYLFHNIYDDPSANDLYVTKSRASNLFNEIGKNIENGTVWNPKFEEAMQYAQEYGANPEAQATAYYDLAPYMTVSVTDDISRIDTDEVGKFKGLDMYDYPLSVKVAVPFDWDYVKLTQSYNDRSEVAKTFIDGTRRYVYANVVPDKEAAILTEAKSSDYVSWIKAGGTAIPGFDPAKLYYNVELPYGTTVAPTVTAEKGSATQATLSGGEGSAFVTYKNLKYEIHFSVKKQGPSVLLRIDPSLDDASYTATKKIVAELKDRGINANITDPDCFDALSGSYDNAVYCSESGADTASFDFDDSYGSGKTYNYKSFTASYNANSGRARLIMTVHPNSKGNTTYDNKLFGTFKDQIDFLLMQGVTFE